MKLMSDSGGISEDQNDDKNVESKVCAHEISEGSKESIGNWARIHLCYILTKSFPYFPCVLSLSVRLSLKVMD